MNTEVQSIDITNSSELLNLVEEVRRSGAAWLLKRGEQDLALLTPVASSQEGEPRRPPAGDARDTLLNIIGIGESAEPTAIAQHEGEYLAEAYTPARR